jgi:hypothetical protein
MTIKYKIVGKARPKHKYEPVSVEAFRLAEDIQTLEWIMYLLDRLDPDTINDDRNESGLTIRRVHFILAAVHRRAWDKLRCLYLGGHPPLPRREPQTMADVWELLKVHLDHTRNIREGSVPATVAEKGKRQSTR